MLLMACVVSMRFGWLRLPCFPMSVSGFYGFHGLSIFSAVSMVFMLVPSFLADSMVVSTSASFTFVFFCHGTSLSCSTRSGTAPSPLQPPTRFYFLIDFPCYLQFSLSFFHRYRFFGFIFSFLIFIYIHRDLSLCASFLVRIAGGGAAPLFSI